MNFLDGQVIRDPQGKLYFRVEEEPWFLPLKSRLNFFDSLVGKWVTVGVRPENLKLREPNQEAVDSGLPIMEILLIEPLGTTNLVTLGRGHWRLLALVERREWLSERRTTAVDLEMDRTCWFDRSVGWALGSGDPAG
jgi:ABC-type sugar transport system ATPase subunit